MVYNPSDFYSRMSENTHQPSDFWRRMKLKWNGGHQLLPSTESPTISASTTSTNLSTLEFQSSSTINKFITLQENLRTAIPETEPLQSKIDMSVNSCQQEHEGLDEQLYQKQGEAPRIKILNQIIIAIAVSWVSLNGGYVAGYTSPAEISMKQDLNISSFHFSWISGSMPLAAVIGGLLGGPLIELAGRKWTILITNVLFLIGWVICYFAPHFYYLYGSRITSGLAVGIGSLVLPVYLTETIQPEVRGTLGLLPTAFGNIGILFCFSMGFFSTWRNIAGIGAFLSLPFLLAVWIIPETPRFYISKGQKKKSLEALKWLRGESNPSSLQKEFNELVESSETSNAKSARLSDFLFESNWKPLLIVLGLMFFQQMSGINAIIFYTTQIFEDTGSNIPSSIQTIIVGVVNFISTFIATVLIDRLGRKILLYISSVAMVITLSALGAYFYVMNVAGLDVSNYGWIPLASFVVYVLGFSFGFGPIPWLMMGEILPSKIRGPAASLCTGFNWTCTFVVTTAFHLVKDIIGAHGVFWLFCAIVVKGLVFTILVVPETKGQSLEDIERKFAGDKGAKAPK